jgi:hypothetical protein
MASCDDSPSISEGGPEAILVGVWTCDQVDRPGSLAKDGAIKTRLTLTPEGSFQADTIMMADKGRTRIGHSTSGAWTLENSYFIRFESKTHRITSYRVNGETLAASEVNKVYAKGKGPLPKPVADGTLMDLGLKQLNIGMGGKPRTACVRAPGANAYGAGA